MVERQDPKMHGGIKGVDAATMEIKTDLETYKASLANVVPAQMAGRIARDAGLANARRDQWEGGRLPGPTFIPI